MGWHIGIFNGPGVTENVPGKNFTQIKFCISNKCMI